MTRRYASEILPIIGPDMDIPAPDVYTDAQTMAWMMDTYAMTTGHASHAGGYRQADEHWRIVRQRGSGGHGPGARGSKKRAS